MTDRIWLLIARLVISDTQRLEVCCTTFGISSGLIKFFLSAISDAMHGVPHIANGQGQREPSITGGDPHVIADRRRSSGQSQGMMVTIPNSEKWFHQYWLCLRSY